MPTLEHISLLHTLFKGREDVFALRWEKAGKSLYSPAYDFDPYHFRLHKIRGGSLADYTNKTHRILDDEEIKKHLAGNHQSSLTGIRYMLTPFSLVFLVRGRNNQYLVIETVDTEEATYIWDLGDQPSALNQQIEIINHQLNQIRLHGRTVYLKSPPLNFRRIIHDYSDPRKGFVLWKAQIQSIML